MAIKKTAKNLEIDITNNYTVSAKKIEEEAEKIIINSSEENLFLNSNKKIVTNGNK